MVGFEFKLEAILLHATSMRYQGIWHLRHIPKPTYKSTRTAFYLLFGGPCEVSCRRRLTNSSYYFVKIEIENNFLGFPEWDLNLGLLSARRAPYQLSYWPWPIYTKNRLYLCQQLDLIQLES